MSTTRTLAALCFLVLGTRPAAAHPAAAHPPTPADTLLLVAAVLDADPAFGTDPGCSDHIDGGAAPSEFAQKCSAVRWCDDASVRCPDVVVSAIDGELREVCVSLDPATPAAEALPAADP